ncbi:hypothetical protein CPT_Muldoon_088 [Serratia phage Muldoon]|uniref:Uncharacterized protein n=1 Tax=Serratia phage Muldoon TaxID=2601678 RepID=A0A5P8PH81_9CAUD|nr:hypothetical protein HYP94_gp087 [Serratia phage Muldoon]QFR56043.1 hypothetical protein CPT_Muldoon_088 [Serratia phage Muldoon]
MTHDLKVGYWIVTRAYDHTQVEIVTHDLVEGHVLLDITPAMPKIKNNTERYVKKNHSWTYASTIYRFDPSKSADCDYMADLLREIHVKNSENF